MADLLIWRDGTHFDHRGDLPCALCRKPTPLRSHAREPAHKTCAEAWNEANPGETRFVSDAPRRSTRDHA